MPRYLKCVAVIFLVLLSLPGQAQNQPGPVRIGVVVDGPWERNDEVVQLFQREISDLLRGEFDVAFPPEHYLVSDWTIDGVKGAIDRLLNDPRVDLVIASGVIASNDVCHREDLPKPVIAPFVIDPVAQDLPRQEDGSSGIANLNYVALPSTFLRDLKMFREIVQYDEAVILLNQRFVDAVPDIIPNTNRMLAEIDATVRLQPIDRSVDEFFDSLTGEEDAVYVAPLIHLPTEELDRLISGLIANKLPSFSLMGRAEVERGLMATLNTEFFPRITRRVALNIQRILLGDDPGSIPVTFAAGERLTINMATVTAIDVWPSWAIINEAELINESQDEIIQQRDLRSSVHQAIEKNLDLLAKGHFVDAGAQSISRARSQLLPQLEISATGLLIDDDRAAASFGSQAERTVTGAATLTQVIYSEAARANHSIQKHLQRSRIGEADQLRLDIAASAATAYLNVLRSQTFERIQKQNLALSRTNLELARVREAVGFSGRSDVYRWESQIAASRRELIFSNAGKNLTELALNRLLHRPLEEPFELAEARLQDVSLAGVRETFVPYRANKILFRAYRAFMAREAQRNAPELDVLDAAIKAQERALSAARRDFWIPTVAVQAGLSSLFSESGAGVASPFSPAAFQGIPGLGQLSFPQQDDTSWNVSLNLSFPLFSSGRKRATRIQATEELSQLQVQRNAIAERIEERVRAAMHRAGASYAGIEQSQKAAEAASRSLDLVRDAYSNGSVSIIDLLDAQNAALTSNLAAASAVYDFLIDFIAVERGIGGFGFLRSDQEQMELISRLQAYFVQMGLTPNN